MKFGTNWVDRVGVDFVATRVLKHAKKLEEQCWVGQLAMLTDCPVDNMHSENPFLKFFCCTSLKAQGARKGLFGDDPRFAPPWCERDGYEDPMCGGLSYEVERPWEDLRVRSPFALAAIRRVFGMHNADINAGMRESRLDRAVRKLLAK